MRTKKVSKKIVLNKTTVTNLNSLSMEKAKAGYDPDVVNTLQCVPPTGTVFVETYNAGRTCIYSPCIVLKPKPSTDCSQDAPGICIAAE